MTGHGAKFPRKMDEAIAALLTRPSIEEAARTVGIEPKTLRRWMREQEFKAKYFFEMVYTPSATKMVKLARAKGMHVIVGAEMFVQQGGRQFEIWTGKPAPVLEMQRVVEFALAQRAAAKNNENNKKVRKKK